MQDDSCASFKEMYISLLKINKKNFLVTLSKKKFFFLV